jgi:hypothetical protein
VDAHGDATAFWPPGRTTSTPFWWSALVSLFLFAHAVAHLVGTSRALQAGADGGSIDYLGGAWRITDPVALRVAGIAWAVVAVAYVAAAAGEWLGWRGWWQFAVGVTVFSMVLTIIGLWESWIGVIINLVILGVWWRAEHPDNLLGGRAAGR